MNVAGPYSAPPIPNLQCSGVGVVPKKGGAWRLIMHLSAPCGSSVNDHIHKENFTLRYSTVDSAIAMLHQLGSSATMAKVDAKHAFRLCPVRREDWDLLGLHWKGRFYVDKRLPFGLRSAPSLLNGIADALHWVLVNECIITNVIHYLDDIFIAASSEEDCAKSLAPQTKLLAQLERLHSLASN